MPVVSARIPNRRQKHSQNRPVQLREGRPIPNTYAWSVTSSVEPKQSLKPKMPAKPGRFMKNLSGKVVYSPNKPGPINFTVDYNWTPQEADQQISGTPVESNHPFAGTRRPKSAPPSKWNYIDNSGGHTPIFSTTELNDDVVSQRFVSPNYAKNNSFLQRPKSDGPINKPQYPNHTRLTPTGAVQSPHAEQFSGMNTGHVLSVEERLRSLVNPSAGIADAEPQISKPHFEDSDILLPPKKDRTASTDDSVFYDNEAFDGCYSPFRGIAKQLGTNYIPSRPSEKKPGPRAEVILNRPYHTPTTVPPPYRKLPSYHQSTAFIRNNENQDELQDICNRLNKMPENSVPTQITSSQPILSKSPIRQVQANALMSEQTSSRPTPVGESSPSSRNSSFLSALGEGYISYSKPGMYPHFTNTSSVTVPLTTPSGPQISTRPKDYYFPQYHVPEKISSAVLETSKMKNQGYYGFGIQLMPSDTINMQKRINNPAGLNSTQVPQRSRQHEINELNQKSQLVKSVQDSSAEAGESKLLHHANDRIEQLSESQPVQFSESDHEDSSHNSGNIPKLGDPFSELHMEFLRPLASDEESMRSVTPPLPPLSPTTSVTSSPSPSHQITLQSSSLKQSPPAPDLLTNTNEISLSPTRGAGSPHVEVKRRRSVSRLTRNASYEKRLLRQGINESSESDIEISSSSPDRSRSSPIRIITPSNQIESHDAAIIHKKLDGLEVMYHEILKMLGIEKDFVISARRNSTSSIDMGKPAARFLNVSAQKTRHKDMKLIDKRFARLESHVVTLARSVAHLSSEMRQHNVLIDELESVKQELFTLKQQQNNIGGAHSDRPLTEWEKFRKWVSSITNPRRVNKLRKFFGQDPLLHLFLEKLGYEKYAQRLDAEKIGMIELPYLTEDRLQKIGIPMGPRLRILQEAQLCFRQENLDIYII
ncbi:uncharacterized protein LOC141903702 isoform X2 [Tubulanus polymorphus]|uniref:uncharacterized protein LOC141903702 isoform X2 n=1 Tax=Tubulanus polymorphus TaxID=672921 RepID=UPI003DA3D5E2